MRNGKLFVLCSHFTIKLAIINVEHPADTRYIHYTTAAIKHSTLIWLQNIPLGFISYSLTHLLWGDLVNCIPERGVQVLFCTCES